jgi:hypothetical protein
MVLGFKASRRPGHGRTLMAKLLVLGLLPSTASGARGWMFASVETQTPRVSSRPHAAADDGLMHVIKRDGRRERVMFDKITKRLRWVVAVLQNHSLRIASCCCTSY